MKTRILDMSKPEEIEIAQVGYYLLFKPELQCIEQLKSPETEHMKRPWVKVVCAYDDEGIKGIMMVDNDAVVFPVLSGDPVQTLKALSLAAFEANGGYLEFQTNNQLICDLALAMEIPEIQHDGNFFWWGEKESESGVWGAGR